jgi:hypothetical protein
MRKEESCFPRLEQRYALFTPVPARADRCLETVSPAPAAVVGTTLFAVRKQSQKSTRTQRSRHYHAIGCFAATCETFCNRLSRTGFQSPHPSIIPIFHSSNLPIFHSSTLPLFHSSILPLFHPHFHPCTPLCLIYGDRRQHDDAVRTESFRCSSS